MKRVRNLIASQSFKTYHKDTYAVQWTSNATGTLNHMCILMSKMQEWLWLARNYFVPNSVASQWLMHYSAYQYHFKNNDNTANDYYIWRGKVKKDIPTTWTQLGVSGSVASVSAWWQLMATFQMYNSTASGGSGGGSAVPSTLLKQYNFKPGDAWMTKRYVRWGKPKFMRLAPGQRFTLKMRVGAKSGSPSQVLPQSGAAGAIPNPGAAATVADGAAATTGFVAFKGDHIYWIMARGTIANTAADMSGTSTLTRAHTDIIVTDVAKYSFSATNMNFNYLLSQSLASPAAPAPYAVNYNVSQYNN